MEDTNTNSNSSISINNQVKKNDDRVTELVFRVFRNRVLYKHVISFIAKIGVVQRYPTSRYEELSDKSVCYLRYCHSDDLVARENYKMNKQGKGNYGREFDELVYQQQQRSFNMFKYKIFHDNDPHRIVIYYVTIPLLLRHCKQVGVLERMYQLVPYHFKVTNRTSDGSGPSPNDYILNNIVIGGSLECLRYAIETIGIQPNNKTLQVACENGRLDMVVWLVDTFPHALELTDAAIEDAALNAHVSIISYVLDTKKMTKPFTTRALYNIAHSGSINHTKLLLDFNISNNNNGQTVDSFQQFYLMQSAVSSGSIGMVELIHSYFGNQLIESGALDRETVEMARGQDSFAIVNFLIETYGIQISPDTITTFAVGGRLDEIKYFHDNNLCMGPWLTETMDLAAKNGCLNVVEWLHCNRTEGCSSGAMYYAALSGHLSVVQYLYHHYPGAVHADAVNNACIGGHLEIVKLLTSSPDRRPALLSRQILSHTVEGGTTAHFDVIQYLVLEGLVPKMTNRNSGDFFKEACHFDQVAILQYFHQQGLPGLDDPMLFEYACSKPALKCAKFLYDHNQINFPSCLEWATGTTPIQRYHL
ncbi:hypothetical protein DFA_04392 [Cavenderia fasciculata]|uniref:Ankyrin repeat-containing protein n=1 Tax=Cavenderia fasciculata TaxID=261658 RepID=F4PPG1_CACFS|nr:uncharacterized protein DFA_04392 [Cavenderia fasciculata]EGG22274.1 hypothetical protein DFA_04392 [Cavenderia fasciculata]|eukprot:XP_004360125.1 hypothetical protein DFA_04392 [Cavenderia fasciculata]